MQRHVQSLKEVRLELWPNVKGEDGEIQKRNPKSLGWTDCGNSEEPLKEPYYCARGIHNETNS